MILVLVGLPLLPWASNLMDKVCACTVSSIMDAIELNLSLSEVQWFMFAVSLVHSDVSRDSFHICGFTGK